MSPRPDLTRGVGFTDLVPDAETFAKLLKKNRVAVAHHLSGAEGSTQQIFLSRAAAWLLLICLLRDAEAPEQDGLARVYGSWRWHIPGYRSGSPRNRMHAHSACADIRWR